MLYGEGDDDWIHTWDGVDTAYGGGGEDFLQSGSVGFATIYGGPEDDEVHAGDGGALVYGEGGDDYINGGRERTSFTAAPGTTS